MSNRRFYLILSLSVLFIVIATRLLNISIYWILGGAFIFTVLYFFWCLYQERRNRNYFQAILKLLEDECDPYQYVMACWEGYEKYAKSIFQKTTAESNIALGYFLAGETEKAIEIEKELQRKNEMVWKWPALELVCIVNLSSIYFSQGDLEELKGQLERFQIAERKIKKGKLVEQVLNLKKRLEVYISLLEGDLKNVEAWCLEQFEKAESKYAKVSMQYELALFYEKNGEPDRQKECLSYVIEHGNRLDIVRAAKEKLEFLG